MRRSQFQKLDVAGESIDIALSRDISSQYDNVKIVADNIDAVVAAAALEDEMASTLANLSVISTVGSNIADVILTANEMADINSVVDNLGSINSITPHLDDIQDVAGALVAISAVDANEANINAVAGNSSNINAVAGNSVNIATVVADSSAINILAANMLDVNDIADHLVEILMSDESAATALAQAGIATTQAGVATTQAGLANGSAIAAANARDAIYNMGVATGVAGSSVTWDGTTLTVPQGIQGIQGIQGANGDSVYEVSSNKVGKVTTVTVKVENHTDAQFVVNDGADGIGSGDMLAATYDTDGDGKVNAAVVADGVAWTGVTGKPTSYPPEVHDHDSRYYTETEVQTVLPKVGFDLTNIVAPGAGQMAWNQDERTVDLGVNGVTLQLGQEQLINVRNNTASVIANKTVVMATGTLGASGRITVAPYDGGAARFVLGIATEDIAVGSDGFVTTFGKVREVNTSMWADGTVLYASTGGALTSTEPSSGVKLPMAIVINSHATAGTLFVRVTPIDENAFQPADEALTAMTRADRYLASQNIAAMVYSSGNLVKIQYNTSTDVDYEVLGYTSGNLTSIQHYTGSVLKGTTTLVYTDGALTSAVFVGV